uniref:DUF5681 domain-containing protein n=1 Tax=Anisakis simplex TaxID=6269 RepID=A0A0M3JFT1_ANISI
LLSGLIDTMRSHDWGDGYLPFDDRFEGPVVLGAAERNDKDYNFENRIILQAFVLWIAVKLKQLTAEEGSAAYLSEAFVRIGAFSPIEFRFMISLEEEESSDIFDEFMLK